MNGDDFRFQLKDAAIEFSKLGFLVLDVKRDKDTGAPGKSSIQKWSKAHIPGTNREYLEDGVSWKTASGIWVRIPDLWVVLDPDSDAAEAYWEARLGPWLSYAAVNKPPNGRPHYWFRVSQSSADQYILNWSSLINDDDIKFDIRGQYRGGVMAPPSEHHRGGNRAWIDLGHLQNVQELPHEAAGLLHRHRLPGAPQRSGKDLQPLGDPQPARYTNGSHTTYGHTALTKEITRLRRVWRSDDGQFNNTLNIGAFSIGQLVSGGELSHATAYDSLVNLLAEFQAPKSEFKTLDSGYFDGYDRPRSGPVSSKYFGPVSGEEGDGLLVKTLALDVIKEGRIATGLNGHTWAYEDGAYVMYKDVIRNRTARFLEESFRVRHYASVDAMVKSLIPRLSAEAIPHFINFRNGLYDWKDDRLLEHTPDVLSTVQLNTNWNSSATCPETDKFLAEVLPPDVIPMMWELMGYLMYSGNPLHKAVMLTGTGRNGKGTWLRLMTVLLGEDNVSNVTLAQINNDRFACASLLGKIANIAGDIDGTYLESTAKFKAITGQDRVNAEYKNKDSFDFWPWAVPVFSANKVPGSADVTVGYMSRWVVIPFPNDFSGREDRNLDERLQHPDELAGIAARATCALRDLMRRGNFEETVSAAEARNEFRRQTDQVAMWIADCCDVHPQAMSLQSESYKAYKEWALENGHRPLSASEFHRRVEQEPGVERVNKKPRGAKGSLRYHAGLEIQPNKAAYMRQDDKLREKNTE